MRTELGLRCQDIMSAGGLVPDDLIIALVKRHLEHLSPSYKYVIFDGFPRTLEQAKKLDQVLNIKYVFSMKVHDDVVVERICGRRVHLASGRS